MTDQLEQVWDGTRGPNRTRNHRRTGNSSEKGDGALTATAGAPTGGAESHLGSTTWRVIDISVSSLALIILMPFLLLVSILVRTSSPGPVIFKQHRVGRDGRLFKVWKFRSMRVGAHTEVMADPDLRSSYFKNDFKLSEEDPRITKIGRKLRKTSIDEIPQLLNVIRGDMSLVGVRPLLPEELALRPENDQELYRRYRPGITGLWQVEGRAKIKAGERIDLDRRYLEQWSLRTNIKIALRTPMAVLKGNGAF